MSRYKIATKDGRAFEYGDDDLVDLIVMQQTFNPRIYDNDRYNDETIKVIWFDMRELHHCEKNFNVSLGFKEPRQIADRFYRSLEKFDKDNPMKYAVKVKAKDVYERKEYFQKHLRFLNPTKEYPERFVPIPPRIFGLWLGDGSKGSAALTNIDDHVIQEFKDYNESIGLDIKVTGITYTSTQNRSASGRVVNEDRVWDIILDHETGMSIPKIAKKFGHTFETVKKYIDMYLLKGEAGIDSYFEELKPNPFKLSLIHI